MVPQLHAHAARQHPRPARSGSRRLHLARELLGCRRADDFPLGSKVNEALRWNGHDWSYIITPSVAAGENPALYAVTCTSSANCWAVGGDFDGNQAIHWNGHKWSTA